MGKNEPDNAGYVRLRTILDSLEIGAIRYFLEAPTVGGKQERLGAIQSKLMPIIEWLWDRAPVDTDCPEGYSECDGVCVPYPCPHDPKIFDEA